MRVVIYYLFLCFCLSACSILGQDPNNLPGRPITALPHMLNKDEKVTAKFALDLDPVQDHSHSSIMHVSMS